LDEKVGRIELLAAERSRYRDALVNLAADFRQRAEDTEVTPEDPDEPDQCASPAECHAGERMFTWKHAALLLERALTPPDQHPDRVEQAQPAFPAPIVSTVPDTYAVTTDTPGDLTPKEA
jgi:hypothetical protein